MDTSVLSYQDTSILLYQVIGDPPEYCIRFH